MKVNVKKIFNDYRLDVEVEARKLFPKNTYPVKALSRVFKNQALLNSTQLYILAESIGVSVSELYFLDETNKLHAKNGVLRIGLGGGVVATLKIKANFKGQALDALSSIKGKVFYHSSEIPLSDYINKIHSLIKNS